jgi:hypothetical protein
MPTKEIIAEAFRFYPDAVLFGHSGPTSGHPVIAGVAGDRNGGATRIDRLWQGLPDLSLARNPEPGILRHRDRARRRRGDRAATDARAGVPSTHRRGRRCRIPQSRPSMRDAAGARDSRSRCLPDRLGADRSCPVTAIGAACAPWWCSSRVAVRTSAIIAANAVSGRAGGIAIRFASYNSWRSCIVTTVSR